MSLQYHKLSVSSFVDVQQSVKHVNSVEGLLLLLFVIKLEKFQAVLLA